MASFIVRQLATNLVTAASTGHFRRPAPAPFGDAPAACSPWTASGVRRSKRIWPDDRAARIRRVRMDQRYCQVAVVQHTAMAPAAETSSVRKGRPETWLDRAGRPCTSCQRPMVTRKALARSRSRSRSASGRRRRRIVVDVRVEACDLVRGVAATASSGKSGILASLRHAYRRAISP